MIKAWKLMSFGFAKTQKNNQPQRPHQNTWENNAKFYVFMKLYNFYWCSGGKGGSDQPREKCAFWWIYYVFKKYFSN